MTIARLRRADADALVVWVATRVAIAVTVFAAARVVVDTSAGVPSWLSAWDHWDVGLFVKIARFGYDGYPAHYPDQGVVAFFPGEPLAVRAVHVVVRSWIVSGLLISAVAGAVASVALARLAAREVDGDGVVVGRRAVLYLMLSPYAVFLFAGYSEALFLALALPAWLAARDRRWVAAGVLGAGAATVRVTGVFLAVALVVEAVTAGRAAWRPALAALALPFLAVAGYFAYLRVLTGDWLAWSHAQRDHWGRSLTAPWTALHTTWNAARSNLAPPYLWGFRAEILAVAVGVVLTVVLVVARRWGEATYVGLQVVSLATSSYYLSVARATLLWWPLWLLLARASVRRRWVHPAYLAVAPALMVTLTLAFTRGHWVD